MAASLSGVSPQTHVPAWKRIGLKLKYAKDVPEPNDNEVNASAAKSIEEGLQDVTNSQSLQPKQKKRKKLLMSTDGEQSQAKRSKISTSAQPDKSSESSSTIRDSSDELVHGDTHLLLRKKSVSFTAETKEEDGSSATTLSKAWFSQQQSDQPHVQTSPPEEVSDSVKVTTETGDQKTSTDPSAHSTPQSKKQKKAKNREKSLPQEPEPAYIKYLETFHTDKASWKFNKSKQNDLLKNIWNIYRIHPDKNDALYSYISGLQGAAAAKRLHEGAENVLNDIVKSQKTNIESMESSASRKAAYEAALERQIEIYEASGAGRNEHDDRELEELEELRQSVERGRRALGIIDLVAEKAGVQQQLQSTSTGQSMSLPTTGSGTAALNSRRKRKARTQVSSDEDSSSDSSDSDSDDSSSESDSSSSGSSTE